MPKLMCSSILLLLFALVTAQDKNPSSKGVSEDEENTMAKGITRALIVGISKYQNIKSLDYADKDAIEFARFLSGNSVWNLPDDNVFLLTNEKAKAGNILAALTLIIDSSKNGDKVIFYFSGHGDVETKADSSQGFLLAYDSPHNNYTTGAISISILQKAFGQLISKGVKLVLITDACRSGHLAGGVEGVEQTAKAFNLQWKNQTKILSAQPDEVSYEGKNWGGGRGVFSFFLVKGLYGFADANHDSIITLSEIEQYAGLQIAEETKFKQQPIFEGPSKFSLQVGRLDTAGMERYREWKTGSEIAVFFINKKERGNQAKDNFKNLCPGYDSLDDLLNHEKLDSGQWVKAFKLYDVIQNCPEDMKGNLKYKISALLMNDLQQTVNQSLLGQKLVGMVEINSALKKIDRLFKINKDKEIFYADHFANIHRYFTILKLVFIDTPEERKRYFKEYNLAKLAESAIKTEPTAAYIFFAKGITFSTIEDDNGDSALFYFKKAHTLSPTWLMPKLMIGHVYKSNNNIDSALYWYESILKMDTLYQKFECNICFFQELADLYNSSGRYLLAETFYKKGLAADPENLRLMIGLAKVYSATKQSPQILSLLTKIESHDTTIIDKLETLETIIDYQILKKDKISERLETLLQSIKKMNDEGPDKELAMASFYFVRGLFHEKYRLGNGLNDFRNAAENYENYDYGIKFRLEYIKTSLEYLNLENSTGTLGEYIELVLSDYKDSLSKEDIQNLKLYKAIYTLFAGLADDKVANDLNNWFNKKIIDCNTLNPIKKGLNYLQKHKSNFQYPQTIKALLFKCQ